MKVGVWFYATGTILTGVLNITWGAFDASHQPIQALGKDLPGQHVLACVMGIWLVAAGMSVVWRRTARIGFEAAAIAYIAFAALWMFRYYTGIHALGWRIDVLFGVTFGLAQQVILLAPAAIVFAATSLPNSLHQKKAVMTARWMLGAPSVIFGLFHFIGLRIFATLVPHWMLFGHFWAGLTGAAFFLAGCAICSGKMDVLAAKLLALMLLLFEGLVEIPPIFLRPHSEPAWGAAVYNVTAIGACWIFAEFVARRCDKKQLSRAEEITASRTDALAA